MRQAFILLSTLTAWLISFPAHAADQGFCDVVNGDITDVPTASNTHYYCFPSFQSARVRFHDIMVCTEQPELATYRDICTPLFSKDSGEIVELTKGEAFALPSNGPVSLSTGVYTHLAMVITPTLEHKFSIKFDTPRRGITGEGQYCWTTSGGSWKYGFNFSRSNVECGDLEDVNAQFSTEPSFKCQGTGGSATLQTSIPWSWDGANIKYSSAAWVGSDRKTEISGAGSSCPASASAVPNIDYQIAFQRLATDLNITPSTSTIDFFFDPEGAGLLKMLWPGQDDCPSTGLNGNPARPCMVTLRSRAPQFVITAK